ncbi:hypothetical protein ABW20_dc0108430 [Dactylellina cionopaga]|nr:hypothetical protein ABW20_dc0108430 [Dactylellina cionopaga]
MPLLKELLVSLPDARIIGGSENTPVTQIYYDTQKLTGEPGSALICFPRDQDEGIDRGNSAFMAAEGVKRGAAVIICEDEAVLNDVPGSITTVLVPDVRRATALMAAEFYGHPSRKLLLIGLTGTNGKTTTAHLIAEVLRGSGLRSVGVIGTLGANTENTTFDTGFTTPMSLDTQRLLAEFLDKGVEAVVMEVSSHGLGLQRVVGCAFDVALFTNFSQDHLDFHETMEEYWATKVLFFTEVAEYSLQYKKFTAIINTDDEYGRKLVKDIIQGYPSLTFGVEGSPGVKAENLQLAPSSIRFDVSTSEGNIPFNIGLTGRFNIYNALTAISLGVLKQIPMSKIQATMKNIKAPAGRMEFISEGQDFNVVVDYAHNAGGLQHVLSAIREFGPGNLICVFGAGGDREPAKRPQMGAVVAELADIAVITSDNPRTEDPSRIIEDIKAGTGGFKATITAEVDRRKAIEYAIGIARPRDFIVIAGKGHETYQVLKDKTIPFDDREVVREVLWNRQSESTGL